MCSTIFGSELGSFLRRFKCLLQTLLFLRIGDQEGRRVRLDARQLRPRFGIIWIHLERFLVSGDRGGKVPCLEVGIALLQIRLNGARWNGRSLKQRLDIAFVDLLQNPDTSKQHHNPQEHPVNIRLGSAVE